MGDRLCVYLKLLCNQSRDFFSIQIALLHSPSQKLACLTTEDQDGSLHTHSFTRNEGPGVDGSFSDFRAFLLPKDFIEFLVSLLP